MIVATDRNTVAIPRDDLRLIWGAEAIGAEIGVCRRRSFHLLEKGRIPGKKVGGRWVVDRTTLHSFFRPEPTPPLQEQATNRSSEVNGGKRPSH